MIKRLHALINGRVQRVGFRDFVEDTADSLNISGWVRNLYSGEVEVTAEGEEADLRRFSALIAGGPSLAFVTDFREEWQPATGEFRGFQIRASFISD